MDKIETFEKGGRTFKTTMFLPERHYKIEEKLGEVAGGALARVFVALDGGGGIDAARAMASGEVGAIDGAELGGAVVELFAGLKRVGGFFAFAQEVLKDTQELDADGRAAPVKIDSWRGEAKLIEDLTFHVLRFNFEAYFLSRRAELAALLASKKPASSAPKSDPV